jgi:hypothetical protein
MLIQNLVERDANECQVRMAGIQYMFKRNVHGHLVAEVTDPESIKRMITGNAAFRKYEEPVTVAEAGLATPPGMPEGELIDKVTFDPPVRIAKGGTVEWLCEICGKPFPTQRALRGHMGGAHTQRS